MVWCGALWRGVVWREGAAVAVFKVCQMHGLGAMVMRTLCRTYAAPMLTLRRPYADPMPVYVLLPEMSRCARCLSLATWFIPLSVMLSQLRMPREVSRCSCAMEINPESEMSGHPSRLRVVRQSTTATKA